MFCQCFPYQGSLLSLESGVHLDFLVYFKILVTSSCILQKITHLRIATNDNRAIQYGYSPVRIAWAKISSNDIFLFLLEC